MNLNMSIYFKSLNNNNHERNLPYHREKLTLINNSTFVHYPGKISQQYYAEEFHSQ